MRHTKIFLLSFIFTLRLIFASEVKTSTDTQFFSCVVVPPKNYISLSTTNIQSNIEKIIKDVYVKNYNSVAFIIRENGFVVYKTTYNPQIKLANKNLPDFDIISFAYNESKKYNLNFFVIFEVFKATDNFKSDWLCRTSRNEIFKPYYLSCGNLEVQAYIRNLIEEFLKNRNVDGIILSEVKYPTKNTSYDEASLNRFYTRGNPKLLEWEDFQREQINKFLQDTYCLVKSINKNILFGVITDEVYKDSYTLTGVYYENFQDTAFWLENKFCDFLVVKLKDTITNSNLKKIFSQFPKEKVLIYSADFKNNIFRNLKNSVGCLVDYSLGLSSFPFFALTPKVEFKDKIIIGKVFDEKNSPLEDVWISLSFGNTKKLLYTFSGYDGFFSFNNLSGEKFEIKLNYPYSQEVFITTECVGDINILEPIIISSSAVEKEKLFINIIHPKNFSTPKTDTIHILGRTNPKNKIDFYSENFSTSVRVFPTGIFAVDNIKLKLGENIIKFNVSQKDKTSQYEFKVFYSTDKVLPKEDILEEKKPQVIWLLDEKDLLLFSGDVFELKVKAPPKKEVYALCFEDNTKLKMEEVSEGIYYLIYKIPENFSSKRTKLKIEVIEKEIERVFIFFKKEKINTNIFELDVFVEVWNSSYPLIAITTSKTTPISYSTHRQRLGGPYIAELPKGIKLQVIEKKQNNFRVKLSEYLSGWVETKDVELLREEKKPIENSILSCVVVDNKDYDKIVISLKQQVAFSVSSNQDDRNSIVVDFFNSYVSANWIQMLSTTKVIKDIKVEQVEDGWARVIVYLKPPQNWGFWWDLVSSNFVLFIKYPPKIDKKNPLKNLTIALEAGHGGEGNTGALGLSGTKEKNLNLRFTQILKEAFEKENAKVVLMRQGDTNPNFDQRLKVAYDSNSNVIISIHANASSNEKGFLSSSQGPSVYYKHSHCRSLAESIYKELIDVWKKDYGIISNFNYAIVRQTRIPAVLVELGFLTHPEDEAFLLDEAFLKKQANSIVEGTKKFLNDVFKQ